MKKIAMYFGKVRAWLWQHGNDLVLDFPEYNSQLYICVERTHNGDNYILNVTIKPTLDGVENMHYYRVEGPKLPERYWRENGS